MMKNTDIRLLRRLQPAWQGVAVLLSALLLGGCGSSGNDGPHLALQSGPNKYVQDKYAKAVSAAAKRPSYVGLTSNTSSAMVNGRVVQEDRVFVGDTDVTYVTFSFLNNTVLTTGSLDSNTGAAVTEVWRRRSDSFCRVLTTQSNGDPMLPFSVASSAAWIKQDSNHQVTYRLYVGTSEGVVGKISFVDKNPLDGCQSIDNEPKQGHFTVISQTDVVAPVNGLKLAEIQETAPDFQHGMPVLQFSGKRILYFWGSSTDCHPVDGSTSCNYWRAIPASAVLLADDDPKYSGAGGGLPYWQYGPGVWFAVDPDTTMGYTRYARTQVNDMDLRAKFNQVDNTLQLDMGVVYQSPPDTGASTASLDLTRIPNIHTYSGSSVLDPSQLGFSASKAVMIPWSQDDRWTYAAAPGQYDSNTPRYSPYTKLRIFDLDNDPSKPSVALTTYGEGNQASYCPINAKSWRECFRLVGSSFGQQLYSRKVVTTLEVDDAYKGWGFESMGFLAESVQGDFYTRRPGVFFAPMRSYSQSIASSWKGLIQDFAVTEFQSVYPGDNGNNVDGLVDLGDIRALLVPDSRDLSFARLFVFVQGNNNSAYNPVADGSGVSMINGGLMMCTARLDLRSFMPAAFGPQGGQHATATDFAKQLDCTKEWHGGIDGGYKVASARNILLDRSYQSSPRLFNVHWAPHQNLVHVSYISLNGAISQIFASDPDQAWTGQTSWDNISQGRSATCNNLLVKPPVPPTPPDTPPKANVPFWKKALTTVVSLGRYSGGDFKVALEKGGEGLAEIVAEASCEGLTGPENPLGPKIAKACGQAAAAIVDQVVDAVDSKAREAAESGGASGPDYKKLFDATTIKTACHVGD